MAVPEVSPELPVKNVTLVEDQVISPECVLKLWVSPMPAGASGVEVDLVVRDLTLDPVLLLMPMGLR